MAKRAVIALFDLPTMKPAFLYTCMLCALASPGAATPLDDFYRAQRLYSEKRYAEAEPLFAQVTADDPQMAPAWLHRILLALQRGDATTAVTCAERALALRPQDAEYQHIAGHAYGLAAQQAGLLAKLSLARKCLTAYQRAVATAPDNVRYRLSLINYYALAPRIAGGGLDKALAAANDVRQRDPFTGALVTSSLYAQDKDWEQAFAALDGLEQTDPRYRTILYQRGRLAVLSGERIEEGIRALLAYLEQPVIVDPEQPPRAAARLELGRLYERQGDKVKARQAYESALRDDPQARVARDGLARLK